MRDVLVVAAAAAFGAAGAVFMAMHGVSFFESKLHASSGLETGYGGDASCNVFGIQIHGQVISSRAQIPILDTQPMQNYDGSSQLAAPNYTVSNEIEDIVRGIAADEGIKAILVDVDSAGGGVVAGQEIAAAIRRSGKYSVSVIHEVGASSGYLIAAAANKVFAGEDSMVGSIGVTASYLDQTEKNQKEGYTYQQLSSGVFKDTGSIDKPLTDAERQLIMRDINASRDHFVRLVSEYRKMPRESVDKLADGSTMLGVAAVSSGLVDMVGTTWDALDAIEKEIGEPVSLCWQ